MVALGGGYLRRCCTKMPSRARAAISASEKPPHDPLGGPSGTGIAGSGVTDELKDDRDRQRCVSVVNPGGGHFNAPVLCPSCRRVVRGGRMCVAGVAQQMLALRQASCQLPGEAAGRCRLEVVGGIVRSAGQLVGMLEHGSPGVIHQLRTERPATSRFLPVIVQRWPSRYPPVYWTNFGHASMTILLDC
jgi:hypothetical protein